MPDVPPHSSGSQAREADDYLARLGSRVRIVRSRRGMSRKALAKHSAVSERYLAQLEGGTGNCSIELLRRIASSMGVPVAELIDDRPERPLEALLLQQMLDRLAPEELAEARDYLRARYGQSRAAQRSERIALIGLRGGGKSTLGRALAEALSIPFVELDHEIERQNGMQLGEIFEMFGQATFRRMERSALESVLAEHPRLVLATGGSLVTEPASFELLLSACVTVWLRAAPEEHMARVAAQGDLRPMADSARAMDDLLAILQSREPLYAKADITLDTAGRAEGDSLRALLAALGVPQALAGTPLMADTAQRSNMPGPTTDYPGRAHIAQS